MCHQRQLGPYIIIHVREEVTLPARCSNAPARSTHRRRIEEEDGEEEEEEEEEEEQKDSGVFFALCEEDSSLFLCGLFVVVHNAETTPSI